uniref:C2 domain-containing protein n=1 Tax=Branchiostoma floridae TaxID=7739 RepID=C3ZV00_BRAFL|eukprot:XP_002587636.1 hypothetical protein BRAFLDRAFT_231723 [Branchiostoma floridae]
MYNPVVILLIFFPSVHQARNLVVKGKGGTNDAYVTITLGKEKFLTSVAEKTVTPGWNEECDLYVLTLKQQE